MHRTGQRRDRQTVSLSCAAHICAPFHRPVINGSRFRNRAPCPMESRARTGWRPAACGAACPELTFAECVSPSLDTSSSPLLAVTGADGCLGGSALLQAIVISLASLWCTPGSMTHSESGYAVYTDGMFRNYSPARPNGVAGRWRGRPVAGKPAKCQLQCQTRAPGAVSSA